MNALPIGKRYAAKGNKFHFSVATSAMELMRGLSGIRKLDPYHGMLFDFGREMAIMMTPRGLLMPVQVAFLSEGMEIKEISKLDPAMGFMVGSKDKVRYALEVPVGWFAQYSLEIGDRFENIAVPG